MAILYDYHCPDCRLTTESLESSSTTFIKCPDCGTSAARQFPCPKLGTVYGYAETRGKAEAAPHPDMISTEKLGSGEQTYDEWKSERKALHRNNLRKEAGTFGRRKVYY